MNAVADHTARRCRVAAGVTAVAVCTLLSGCRIPSEGADLVVKNATSMTLTVGEQGQVGPGATPHGAGGFAPVTLEPGDSNVFRIGLSPGVCKLIGLAAYDQAGNLIATLPSPICEQKKGQGGTWTITSDGGGTN